ncbi:MAG: acyltransferase, partial [Cyanobium sp.]
YAGGDITIGNNVWICAHVTILPSVSIGDAAVIGAGAVVTQSVPAGETWGGVPARPLHTQPNS